MSMVGVDMLELQQAASNSHTCTITVDLLIPLYRYCAGSSGAVHSVFLINIYLDLGNPGGSGFWVGEN